MLKAVTGAKMVDLASETNVQRSFPGLRNMERCRHSAMSTGCVSFADESLAEDKEIASGGTRPLTFGVRMAWDDFERLAMLKSGSSQPVGACGGLLD